MSEPISIPEFVSKLDMDGLLSCQEHVSDRIREKDNEQRVTIWGVGDRGLVHGWFRDDDYSSAVAFMAKRGREIADKGEREWLEIKPVRVHESEVGTYFDE